MVEFSPGMSTVLHTQAKWEFDEVTLFLLRCITGRGSKNRESAPCGHSAVFEWLMCSRDLSGKCLGIILQGLHRSSVLVTKLYLDAAVSRRLKHLSKISLGHVTDLSYVLPQCYCLTLIVCMDTEKSNGELCIWFQYQTSDCCTPVQLFYLAGISDIRHFDIKLCGLYLISKIKFPVQYISLQSE